MRNLILLVGLPRSGKSSWAMAQQKPVVNRDAIRLSVYGRQQYWAPREALISVMEETFVRALFIQGHQTVIIDAAHNTEKRRDRWLTFAGNEEPDIAIYLKRIDTDPVICRDRALAVNRIELPEVIERMEAEFELHSKYKDWPGPEIDCGHMCGIAEPYGWVPEEGCPIHDQET